MTLTLNSTEINIAYRVLTGGDFDHPTTSYQQAYDALAKQYNNQQIEQALRHWNNGGESAYYSSKN